MSEGWSKVAQADVEDREGAPALFTAIPFALDGGGEVVIATTRPELLPACVTSAEAVTTPPYSTGLPTVRVVVVAVCTTFTVSTSRS